MATPTYIRFRDDIEQPTEDEQTSINGIITNMTSQSQTVAARQHGHAVRASHAKSTGLVTGTLEIQADLPPELSQGLFSRSGTHDVAVRLAQGPGEILHDKISTHRGMSIKIFGVEGPKLKGHENATTQDFVLASGPTFPSGTAAGFLRDEKVLRMATPAPEVVKSAVATVARNVSALSESVTGAPIPVADFFGHPFSHPLSEPYYSQAPIRFGEYVAKIAAFPAEGEGLERWKSVRVDTSQDENAFRTEVVKTFGEEDVVFEVRVQLWTDEESQPIEDASVQWKESESPFRTVAVLRLPKQEAYSEERRVFFDENLTFRPGHALVAHRPLGSVMRARLQVYEALSAYRHEKNQEKVKAPESVKEIPA